MNPIQNPVIAGMAPDPSILRAGDNYYLATSTFHWQPAIQFFKSPDLVNWKLVGHGLTKDEVDLRGTNTPGGIWAPNLSYDPASKRYWLTYSHMQNMAGREFNASTYTRWAKQVEGPWSAPIYLTSIGFDPSLYHENGKHYLAILEWETRQGFQAPGTIVIAEVNLPSGKVKEWHRITHGFTTRGCVEAPQLYHHGDYYYLILASGGTGYGHGVEIGRAKKLFGPYEPDPTGEPIVTSQPAHLFSLGDPDAGHYEMYNPHSRMQKAGHGSLVETPEGEVYLAHLMSRPLPGTKLNPLGRETALQKMTWTADGWLTMADGSNLAKMSVPAPKGTEVMQAPDRFDLNEDFRASTLSPEFMTPYHQPQGDWLDNAAAGKLKIYGRNSLFSQYEPAIVATRASSLDYRVTTKVHFAPNHYSQSAGLGLYYDANNWLYLRLCLSNDEQQLLLRPLQAKLGQRIDFRDWAVPVPEHEAELQLRYHLGQVTMWYRFAPQDDWQPLGASLDVSYLSDEGVNGEPGEIGGYTGLFNFIGAVDAYQHQSYAEFSSYTVENHLEDAE